MRLTLKKISSISALSGIAFFALISEGHGMHLHAVKTTFENQITLIQKAFSIGISSNLSFLENIPAFYRTVLYTTIDEKSTFDLTLPIVFLGTLFLAVFGGYIYKKRRDEFYRKKIHNSESTCQLLFDNSIQILLLLDPNFEIVKYNQTAHLFFQRMFDKDLKKGLAFLRLLPGDKFFDIQSKISAALNREQSKHEYKINSHNDLYTCWLNANFIPVTDATDQIIGVLISALDITEQKEAENKIKEQLEKINQQNEMLQKTNQELESKNKELEKLSIEIRDSEQKYKTIIDNSHDAIFVLRKDKILLINQVGLAMFEYTQAEINEISFWDLIHPEFLEKVKRYTRKRIIGEDIPKTFEANIVTKMGQIKYGEFSTNSFILKGAPVLVGAVRDVSNRKMAEKALVENEKKFRMLFENMLNGFALVEISADKNKPGGKFLEINRSFETLISKPRNAIVGQQINKVIKSVDNILLDKLYQININGSADRFEYFAKEEGLHLDIFGYCLKKNQVAIVINDITKQKLAWLTLQESEEKYRQLAELLPQTVFEFDIHGKFIFVNNKGLSFFGYTKEEFEEGIAVENVISDDDRKRFRYRLRQNYEKADLPITEYNFKKKNGETFPGIVHTSYIFDKDEPVGVRGIIFDITDRKRVEEEMATREKYLAIILSIQLYLMELKPNTGHYQYVCELLGFASDADRVYICLNRVNNAGNLYMEVAATWKAFDQNDNEPKILLDNQPYSDGLERWKELMGEGRIIKGHIDDTSGRERQILEQQGTKSFLYIPLIVKSNFTGFIGFDRYNSEDQWTDTEINLLNSATYSISLFDEKLRIENSLRESEQKLKSLNSTKDKFFSIIAHDLKNPFNAAIGFSQLLLRKMDSYDMDKIKTYIGHILASSKHGYNLLENLLEWSRSQTGRLKVVPEQIDFNEVINTTFLLLKDYANKKQIELSSLLEKKTTIYADKNMIATVFRNLVANAIKFTPNGGQIKISTNDFKGIIDEIAYTDLLEIIVEDNGVGISKDNQQKLFRIDVTLSTAGTENETGTGLGLIICKEFVEKNGGKISVESEENVGTKFKILLPKSNPQNN